jgi:alanyl-tRNA synthetase
MDSEELRKGFLDFFGERGHTLVPSSPLIPQKDPTLLFTNAGMVQFKDVFLGNESRSYDRAVSVQKCMRAGGKHNDLENVGMTGRHHTFFEMLGNFSFGDYFKSDAIAFAWELITGRWNLPKERLWITVFRDDDEAEGLWRKIGVAGDRIKRMDEKDNFWAMGDTGPCGPCSEILIDQGEAAAGVPHDCRGAGCDCDRYLEIWNLVFMQFMRNADGKLDPLPKPSIDTGMGLERISAVVQGVLSNYDTDLFLPILKVVSDMTDHDLEDVRRGMPGRVIADHVRAVTFLIGDGVLPSNEGRGYLLRRVIRRAARYGKELGLNEPFLYKLTATVVDTMMSAYPELARMRTVVAQITQGEEERFIQTLNQGMGRLAEVIQASVAKGESFISGKDIFRLYDTYGFPLDLASDVARDHGLKVNLEEYDASMQEQKERARKSWVVKEVAPYYREAGERWGFTEFTGYDSLEEEVRMIGILKDGHPVKRATAGETVELIFDRTPFYGESGGQAGDQGLLEHPRALAEILTTIKPVSGLFVHQAKVGQGEIVEGETYRAVVHAGARLGAARNHTATHILHATLREILGEHVKQSGSLVTPDRLRFDFGHFKPLTSQEIRRIESVVNERIREDDPVETQVMGFQEAVRAGALAFFDDKYGDRVRVVRIAEFSKELCGGTHCHETGQVGIFKLIQENSIAAGVRRIEALTGEMAYLHIKKQEEDIRDVAAMLKVQPAEVVEKTRRLLAQMREKEKELERLKGRAAGTQAVDVVTEVRTVGEIKVLAKRVQDGMEPKDLRAFTDTLRNRLASKFVAVFASVAKDKSSAFLIAAVSPDLTRRFNAGEIAKEIAGIVGGSGGGRADMAQAGGKNISKLPEALARVYDIVGKNRQ